MEDKRGLVIGGATGIGRVVCTRLAREGASVWINYRTSQEDALSLKAELDGIGSQSWLGPADVCDPAQVDGLLKEIAGEGGIHFLVHSISPPLKDQRFTRTDWESFFTHWQTAVQSAYWLVRGCLSFKAERKLESIVFILSSVVLDVPPVGKSAYVSAKYALLGLARCLAVELAPKGVRVNCVSPGFTPTRLTSDVDERIQEMISRSVPLNRLCRPEDVAAAVAFLVSADSVYLTGINMPVCGGTHMG